ncbi:MAG: hypothetical protein Q9160_001573 [Pyrenula sp. 1 TL-2023]
MPTIPPPPSTTSPSHPPTRASILHATAQIAPYIHRTPLLTSSSLNALLSAPQSPGSASPRLNLFFKCEPFQKIGAFKARGAHNALLRLIERVGLPHLRQTGVATHSSGNHAAALALAAYTFRVPSYVVMPRNSMGNKIESTRRFATEVVFSGPTSAEREEVCRGVMGRTGAVLVPPYDHGDVVMGQGTVGVEMGVQYGEVVAEAREKGGGRLQEVSGNGGRGFDAVVVPLGGGGLLSGIAVAMRGDDDRDGDGEDAAQSSSARPDQRTRRKKPLIFAAEPSHSQADDARRGLSLTPPQRITHVSSTTIADGLRTPVGEIPWTIISDKHYVQGVYAVSEREILMALRVVVERLKVWVEPSAVVGVAVVGWCEEWRGWVEGVQREEGEERGEGEEGRKGWDVGIVLSGGNTTVETVRRLFGEVGVDGDGDGEERGPRSRL